MSYAHSQRRKQRQRELDKEDPERKQVRNLIKRGKAPRLTIAKNKDGALPKRGTYRSKSAKGKVKRLFTLRMNGLIRFTHGVIFSNKAANKS